jgi:hypothetical protein
MGVSLRYTSKFVQLLFLLKKAFPERDIGPGWEGPDSYELFVDHYSMVITLEELDHFTLDMLKAHVVNEMNQKFTQGRK